MAKRRIDTDLWNDSKIMDNFTPEDKYFWLFILTTRYANMCGVFEVSIKQMSRDLGYDEDAVKHLLRRFDVVHNLIQYDMETSEMFVLNWYKYNWSISPFSIKHIEKFIEDIKSDNFKESVTNILRNYVESEGAYRVPIGSTISISTTNTITNTTSKELKEVKKSNDKEISKSKVKNKYGEFKNVLLTDDEITKLEERTTNYKKFIEDLSVYKESSGKKYKSDYATLLNWIRKETPAKEELKGEKISYVRRSER